MCRGFGVRAFQGFTFGVRVSGFSRFRVSRFGVSRSGFGVCHSWFGVFEVRDLASGVRVFRFGVSKFMLLGLRF